MTRTEKLTGLLEPPTDPAPRDETFVSLMRYDALNRLVVTAEQGPDGSITDILADDYDDQDATLTSSLISRFGYDSRNNQTLTIGPKGNTSLVIYDGASRAIETVEHMRLNGQGNNGPADGNSFNASAAGPLAVFGDEGEQAAIRTLTHLDGNGNVVALIDDRGGTTRYAYDTHDRQTRMIFHDGAERTFTYNPANNVTTYITEGASTTFLNTFDPAGRRVSVVASAGLKNPERQTFEYDGLSRITRAEQDITIAAGPTATMNLYHDSLGRVVEEQQAITSGTYQTTHTQFFSTVVERCMFPASGNREVGYRYDDLYRRTAIVEDPATPGADIATWAYYGSASGGRTAECRLANGIAQTTLNNARTASAIQSGDANPAWGLPSGDRYGYDGSTRMIAKRYLDASLNGTTNAYDDTTPTVGVTTAYDRGSNKLFERFLHAESRSFQYQPYTGLDNAGNLTLPDTGQSTGPTGDMGFDSIDRLRKYQRGTLDNTTGSGGPTSGGAGGSVTSPIDLPNTDTQRGYDLDALGNWKETAYTPQGGSASLQRREHNKLNQITRLIDDPSGSATISNLTYDAKGNLIDDGTLYYEYDALNRLIQVNASSSGSPGTLYATYAYDALNRRIQKVVSNGGLPGDLPNGTTEFVYFPGTWQVAEEHSDIWDGSTGIAPTKQNLWGLYIDELIQLKTLEIITTGVSPNTTTYPAAAYYPLQGMLYNAIALTDGSGGIVEAYDCDPYGNTLVFNATGTGGDWWADDARLVSEVVCNYIIMGLSWDSENLLQCNRMRLANPKLGRFIQRDPISYVDGLNIYTTYHLMQKKLDPSGLWVHIAVGGAIGGVIGGVVGGASEFGKPGSTWEDVAWGAAKGGTAGAVGGAVTAGTFGLGAGAIGLGGAGVASSSSSGIAAGIGLGVGAGAAGGLASGVVAEGFDVAAGEDFCPEEVIESTVIGGVSGGIGGLLGVGKIYGAVDDFTEGFAGATVSNVATVVDNAVDVIQE